MNSSIADLFNTPEMSINNKDDNIQPRAEPSIHSTTKSDRKEFLQRSFVHDDQNSHSENETDAMADAAALMVIFYLLFLSLSIVGGIVLGCIVIVRYGLVVLIAVVAAIMAFGIVAAVFTSVITSDAKLTKARSKVKAWHVQVKDVILEEVRNLKDDLNAYSQGTLLLTYEMNDNGDGAGSREEDRDKTLSDFRGGHATEHGDNMIGDGASGVSTDHATKLEQSSQHKPKSIIFRYAVAPFTKISSKNDDIKKRKSTRRLWKRKQKGSDSQNVEQEREAANSYVPPLV
mmetsp:Transcript_4974/g.11034  ORF Transcript_4974/g.11034 Transcript_4974/m.11034 type:complete len:288 (-) Transcript_4974:217-1080(-)